MTWTWRNFARTVTLTFLPALIASRSTGAASCDGPSGPHLNGQRAGDGGYAISFSGDPAQPGDEVSVTVSGISPFKGFLLKTSRGNFSTIPQDTAHKWCGDAHRAVTHSNSLPKLSFTASLTIPPEGTFDIYLNLFVVKEISEWFGPITGLLNVQEDAEAPPAVGVAMVYMPTMSPTSLHVLPSPPEEPAPAESSSTSVGKCQWLAVTVILSCAAAQMFHLLT